MQNYLQWLANETPTKWWHESAVPSEIDEAIANGASGVATNPTLIHRSLIAEPDFWAPYISAIHSDLAPLERAEALIKAVTVYAAEKFMPIFERTNGAQGYALAQLNSDITGDSEAMLDQALRFSTWAPNIGIKLPAVKSALPVIEELAARGIAICTILSFSVAQAMAAADAYEFGVKRAKAAGITPRPIFIVQQGGKLEEYLWEVATDNRIIIDREDVLQSGRLIYKKSYQLIKERDSAVKLMPAGLRNVEKTVSMAGGDVVLSMKTSVQRAILAAEPPREFHIDDEEDGDLIDRLTTIPEFCRAFYVDGMLTHRFVTFGAVQKTQAQFHWTGWIPLETYNTDNESDR